jgi:PEP-CTERM motif
MTPLTWWCTRSPESRRVRRSASTTHGFLEFGGTQNGSDLVFGNTNDLVVALKSCGQYTGSSAVDAAGYTQVGLNTGWFDGAKSVVSTTNPLPPPSTGTGVPEPATLSFMGLGFAALRMGRMRRRKRSSYRYRD